MITVRLLWNYESATEKGANMMGVVAEKYAPKLGQQFFFVRLASVKSIMWFATAHFSKFEPMDTIRVVHFRESVGKVWVRPGDKVEVTERAQVPTHEVSLKLGYVSNPREVFKDEYWYMFKLDRWHRCNYDVAKRYWLGDERVGGLLAANYYALLGVLREARVVEIEKAYRQAMWEHHPDRWPAASHDQKTHDYHAQLATRINAAHDCLTDSSERDRYDQQLIGQMQGGAVRAWPGRGFGTLRAMVEDRGSVVLVKEILSWEPERYAAEGSVPVNRVSQWDREVRFKVPRYAGMMQVGTETIAIPLSLLPPAWDLLGTLRYKIKGIRSGGYSMKQEKAYSFIRVQELELK